MRAKSVSAELCQTAEAKVFLTGLEEAWILAPARSSSLRMKDGSTCDASNCDNVFVDTSPNQSRRYCSDRCSSRANVAAYRARQKAVASA